MTNNAGHGRTRREVCDSEHLFTLNKNDQNLKIFFINCHEMNITSDFYLKFWVFFLNHYVIHSRAAQFLGSMSICPLE